MFVNVGARNLLLQGERQKFLGEEWPRIYATIQRLGLSAKDLLNGGESGASLDAAQKIDGPKPPEEER